MDSLICNMLHRITRQRCVMGISGIDEPSPNSDCTTIVGKQREEFCLVTGLKFKVENWTDYNDEKEPVPFRRRVFCSSLDGRPIRGKNVETLINSQAFKTFDDNDAVSLCCVGILRLVLLGLEDRRLVPNWILRDNYVFRDWYHMRLRLDRDEFKEQRRGYKQMMEKSDDMYENMSRFMEDMSVGQVPLAKEPIIADQHYGISDLSGFQSYQGVPSAFHTLANNISFFNMAMPSSWQTPIPSYLGTPNSQPPIPSHPGTSNWQNPMTSYSLNLPHPMPSHPHDAGLLNT
nr:hypothetical protein [Tanacetum cinerariifolium]